VPREDWRRYVAPAAFLLAATIAILLIRSGLQAGTATPTTKTVVTAPPHKTVSTATNASSGRTTTSSSTPRFWTVQAGDTFGVISTKSGVPVAMIQQLNPNVKSTSLFIGQKLRLR
jgi:LysM repeat protein